jgi:hypothetical protein
VESFLIFFALLVLFAIAAYLVGADSSDPDNRGQWDHFQP